MPINTGYEDATKVLTHHFAPPLPQQQTPYPVYAFPPVLRNVINALHEDTQIPIEMIGSTVLAAASLALQPLIDVIPPHSNESEPCSLYFLTIADSGEGKSSINKRIMKPFYSFLSQMKAEYQENLRSYKQEHEIWNVKKQALASSYRMAIKHGGSGKIELISLQQHQQSEPPKPKCLNLIYEDATPKSLIQGLGDHPFAGVVSDEAITFFKGYLKNNIGLLNKAWEGEVYSYNRPDGDVLDIKARLTLSLMSQSKVFLKFMDRYEDLFESSGFLSRLLITKTVSTVGYRSGNKNYEKSDKSIKEFHKYISELLEAQKEHFYDESSITKTMRLSTEACDLWASKNTQYQSVIVENGPWEHIRSFVSKACMNAIKIAVILNHENDKDIDRDMLANAHSIIEWYLHQASEMFIEKSYWFKFESNLLKVYSWIKDHQKPNIDGNSFNGVERSKMMTSAQEFVRNKDGLELYLSELLARGLVYSFKEKSGAKEYISLSPINESVLMRVATNPEFPGYISGKDIGDGFGDL